MSKQKGYYLDEETWGELGIVAAKRGMNISNIVEKYVLHGLANEIELTSTERYYYSERNIILTLDGILNTFHTVVQGDLKQKISILMALITGISVVSPLRHLRKVAELGLYEVLNDIKRWDIDRFNDIYKEMGRFRYIRQEYITMYPLEKDVR